MPKQLKYLGQLAEDLFYQTYKTDNTDFFTLQDFIEHTGNAVAAIYIQFYQQQYAMLRQEKKEEVVQFDIGWLSEQILDVEKVGDKLVAKLKMPVMTFPYDNSNIGLQDVFVVEPVGSDCELERTTISTLWQLQYLPFTNRMFFYGDVDSVGFYNKGNCNVKKVRVLYVPSIFPEMSVPDGLCEQAIAKAVQMVKESGKGVIQKESLDNNGNKVMESEIDKLSIKG